MIEISLQCFGSQAEPVAILSAEIFRTFERRKPAYQCKAQDLNGRLMTGYVEDYHRWSEPTALFVARGLNAASQADATGTNVPGSFRYLLDINLLGRRLSRTPFAVLDNVLTMSEGRRRHGLVRAQESMWAIAADSLCIEVTGEESLPKLPGPLVVKVYERDGVKYCKSEDLPAEARSAFRHSRYGCTVPYVPGEPDAYYPWDLFQFLGTP